MEVVAAFSNLSGLKKSDCQRIIRDTTIDIGQQLRMDSGVAFGDSPPPDAAA